VKEFENVRQDPGGYKRLFSDSELDLYVWYERRGGEVVGFQLVYDKNSGPRAFTWLRGKGFRHNRVDEGESDTFPMAPVLIADGELRTAEIARRVRAHGREVDPRIIDLVCRVISSYDPVHDNQLI
jgi:hypothetical protein